MNNSTRRVIPYPQADRSDAPDIPLYFKNLVDFLDLDVVYNQGTDAARIAAAHTTSGGRIWWTTDTLQFWYDDGATWRLIGATITRNTLASRPSPAAGNTNSLYFATDVFGGTLYYSDGSVWTKISKGLTETIVSVATTVAGLPATPADGQIAKLRIGQAGDIIELMYDTTLGKWVSAQMHFIQTEYAAMAGNNDIILDQRSIDIGALAAAGLGIETRWMGIVFMSDTARNSTGGVYLDLGYTTNTFSIQGQYAAAEGTGIAFPTTYGTPVNDARMALGAGEANYHYRDTGWILFNPISAIPGLTNAARGWLRSRHYHDDTISNDSVSGGWWFRYRTP